MNELDQFIRSAENLVSRGYYDIGGEISPGVGLTVPLEVHPLFPVIAEVKMSSPSAGAVSRFPAEKLIECYQAGGAAALSVLTEPTRFHGSLEVLGSAGRGPLPVLMKDFIISDRQLGAAARLGAGTVLLVQEVFENDVGHRDALINRAHDLGLEVLLESGRKDTLTAAVSSEADVLGINQRDLRTLAVDRTKGVRLMPLAMRSSRPVVVMSGLDTAEAVRMVRDAGGSGVLIGSHLASDPDPTMALRALEVPR